MTPPSRSRIVPRGAVSGDRPQAVGLGAELELLVLDDLGPEEGAGQDHEGGDQDQLRDIGPLADAVGIESVHASSLMANHSRNAVSTTQREARGGERLQRTVQRELDQQPALPGSARQQHDEVAHPERHRHEGRVDQQVVGEEDGAAPGREIADQGVRQRAGPERARG